MGKRYKMISTEIKFNVLISPFLALKQLHKIHFLTLWRRNYFFLISAHPVIQNVNNTGTKEVNIMKQNAF